MKDAFQPVASALKDGFKGQSESRKERENKKQRTEADKADSAVFDPGEDMTINFVSYLHSGAMFRSGGPAIARDKNYIY